LAFKIGETRYRIALIPFGGYCRIHGEESRDRNENTVNDPRAWFNKSPLLRFLTVIAGPVFNYLFAVIIIAGLMYFGYKTVLISPDVTVVEHDSSGKPTPAAESGLKSGDTIISINNKKIESFDDIMPAVMFNANKTIELTYLNGGKTNHSKVKPFLNQQTGVANIGVTPLYYSYVGLVNSNSPAMEAGIKPGDGIRSIDGYKMSYYYQVAKYIANRTNFETVKIVLARIEGRKTNTITRSIKLSRFEGKGYLGTEPDGTEYPSFSKVISSGGLFKAFKDAVRESDDYIIVSVKGIVAMISGKVDVSKSMAGPLRILQITGVIATRTDPAFFLRFVAIISVALGFMNILPLPGFDGGHAIISITEFLTGRKLPERARAVIEMIGLFSILTLAVLVTYNDIINMFLRR
jgi:regulator of sigma E protease